MNNTFTNNSELKLECTPDGAREAGSLVQLLSPATPVLGGPAPSCWRQKKVPILPSPFTCVEVLTNDVPTVGLVAQTCSSSHLGS